MKLENYELRQELGQRHTRLKEQAQAIERAGVIMRRYEFHPEISEWLAKHGKKASGNGGNIPIASPSYILTEENAPMTIIKRDEGSGNG